MKKFYYFSNSKLKFVEIRNYYQKFLFLVLFFSLIISFFTFGGYFLFKEFVDPNAETEALEAEKIEMKEKYEQLLGKLNDFNERLDSMALQSNDLRLAANLEPILEGDTEIGVGGRVFADVNPSDIPDLKQLIYTLDGYVETVNSKLDLEKNNYEEIERTFELNDKLYDALPAIRPSTGYFGDRFGMRMHPILKVRRMHAGLDIVTFTGTPVYAPGGGVIEFVGYRGGYGLTIEINHGFGYTSLYSHLSKAEVRKGQKVKRGDLIAKTGSSGRLSTGPHLHYEVRHNGIALNPKSFIYEDVDLFEIVDSSK